MTVYLDLKQYTPKPENILKKNVITICKRTRRAINKNCLIVTTIK